MGAKLCLEGGIFEVCFMALDKDPTHATMRNSSAQDVLSSLQNRTGCNGATVHQLGILVPFDDCYFSVHSTLHSLKCGIMPCLAEN